MILVQVYILMNDIITDVLPYERYIPGVYPYE